MANIKLTTEHLNGLSLAGVVRDEAVKAQFINIYNVLWGEGTGEAAYEREAINFNKVLNSSDFFQKATKFSVFTSFIDLAVCGLTLTPGPQAQCYLIVRSSKIGSGPDGRSVYENRCTLQISGYGEILMRMRAGQIAHADNPVLVYAEDEFTFFDKGGSKSVDYTCHLPHNSGKIVAGFMKITRNDGTIDYAVMLQEDWERLQGFSAKNNRDGKANALYTSGVGGTIDTGFLMAKIIKHAFKTYPKVKIGRGTELQSSHSDDEQDYYGGLSAGEPAAPQEEEKKAEVPFGGPANDPAQGISVDVGDDGAF